jgi:molybdate transport system regulatory protein
MSDAPTVSERGQGEAKPRPAPVPPDLEPRAKLWLERDGRIALSEWRVALLEAVEATGSLARAAEQLDVPYRTATYKLREIERNLGVRLLATQSGGAEGGRSRLTPEAREYIRRWRAFSADLDAWVAARFRAAFDAP